MLCLRRHLTSLPFVPPPPSSPSLLFLLLLSFFIELVTTAEDTWTCHWYLVDDDQKSTLAVPRFNLRELPPVIRYLSANSLLRARFCLFDDDLQVFRELSTRRRRCISNKYINFFLQRSSGGQMRLVARSMAFLWLISYIEIWNRRISLSARLQSLIFIFDCTGRHARCGLSFYLT